MTKSEIKEVVRDFIAEVESDVTLDNLFDTKPLKNKKINENDWITEVAEGQRYKAQNKPGNRLLVEKVTIFLGVATLLIVLAIAARAVWG